MNTVTVTGLLASLALLAGQALAASAPATPRPEPRGLMRADTDGDGKVSRQELTAMRDKRQDEWFDQADLNKDGFLTDDELRRAREHRHERRHEMKQHFAQRFAEADTNGDGQLSLDEAQAKMPGLAEHFTAVDKDKNGLLSKDELKSRAPPRAKD